MAIDFRDEGQSIGQLEDVVLKLRSAESEDELVQILRDAYGSSAATGAASGDQRENLHNSSMALKNVKDETADGRKVSADEKRIMLEQAKIIDDKLEKFEQNQ